MSAGNMVFSLFSFLTFVLVSVPLCWHLEAWNAGTCLYIVWAALGNLVYFVNSIIWKGNTVNRAPVWCDISTKFMIGLTVGLPAASLCINRRLYKIATIRKVVTTKADKRRDVIIDLCIGTGIPLLVMALHYIPQGHRFDIFEDIGCLPVTQNTWVAFVVTQAPIIIMTVISGAYSVVSAIAFKRREIELRILLSSTSAPTPNRYLRLMCLAGITVVLTCFVVCAGVIFSTTMGFQPWISWADTHSHFSRVDQQSAIVWRSDPNTLTMLELPRWVVMVYGLLFFSFFGFAQEARAAYCKTYMTIMRYLGRFKQTKNSDVDGSLNAAPQNIVYIQRDDSSTSNSDVTFASEIPTLTPYPLKQLSPLSSFNDIPMPVLHDLNGFLHHESSPDKPVAASSSAGTSLIFSQNQVLFSENMSMLVLQDVSGFLQLDPEIPTPAQLPAALHLGSPHFKAPAAISTRPLITTPNVNTPPPHRPHSFPVSVTSYTSPPPQVVVFSPPHTPVMPYSSASSESMYSMSTATDVSPRGGLFPFPLLPSPRPSQTRGLHPPSASFLDLDTPRATSFLDFNDPPPEPRARGWYGHA